MRRWCCIFLPLTIELSTWRLPFIGRYYQILANGTGWSLQINDHRTKRKCYILQLVLIRFYRSNRYLCIFFIIYFSSIRNSERSRAIVWNSGAPFRRVIAIYYNYYYYGFIYLVILYLWLTMKFPRWNIFLAQKTKKLRRGTIWHIGCEYWKREQFDGQADHWERDCFSVVNRPLLLRISLSDTVTN